MNASLSLWPDGVGWGMSSVGGRLERPEGWMEKIRRVSDEWGREWNNGDRSWTRCRSRLQRVNLGRPSCAPKVRRGQTKQERSPLKWDRGRTSLARGDLERHESLFNGDSCSMTKERGEMKSASSHFQRDRGKTSLSLGDLRVDESLPRKDSGAAIQSRSLFPGDSCVLSLERARTVWFRSHGPGERCFRRFERGTTPGQTLSRGMNRGGASFFRIPFTPSSS